MLTMVVREFGAYVNAGSFAPFSLCWAGLLFILVLFSPDPVGVGSEKSYALYTCNQYTATCQYVIPALQTGKK